MKKFWGSTFNCGASCLLTIYLVGSSRKNGHTVWQFCCSRDCAGKYQSLLRTSRVSTRKCGWKYLESFFGEKGFDALVAKSLNPLTICKKQNRFIEKSVCWVWCHAQIIQCSWTKSLKLSTLKVRFGRKHWLCHCCLKSTCGICVENCFW